jgi:hypothetical protein
MPTSPESNKRARTHGRVEEAKKLQRELETAGLSDSPESADVATRRALVLVAARVVQLESTDRIGVISVLRLVDPAFTFREAHAMTTDLRMTLACL